MGRPTKKGLDYFPLDTDLFADIKVRKLLHYKGTDALAVYCSALCMIYREGYMLKGTTDLAFIIAEQVRLKETRVQDCIEFMLNIALFDKSLFKEHGVLTSRGIQERYAEICHQMKRTCCIQEYNLLDDKKCQVVVNSEINRVSSEETKVNTEFSAQRKEKKNKINISSPLPSPYGEVEGKDIEEEDDFSFKDYFEIHSKAVKSISLFDGKKDAARDRMPILRFLTDEKNQEIVKECIKGWPNDRPLYELRQSLEAMERRGQIEPMCFADWTAISYLKDKLILSELKRIVDKVKTGNKDAWESLVSAVSAVRNNPKIEKPGAYLLKCLS